MLVVMAVYGVLVLVWLAWALGKIRYSWGFKIEEDGQDDYKM